MNNKKVKTYCLFSLKKKQFSDSPEGKKRHLNLDTRIPTADRKIGSDLREEDG